MEPNQPAEIVKEAARRSPWIVISVMLHVVLIAIVSVIYVHHQLAKENASVTQVGIARSESLPTPEETLVPPDIINREAIPLLQDSESAQTELEMDAPSTLVTTDESDLVQGDQLVDPNSRADLSHLTGLPSGGTTGGTAIGAGEGPGHHGVAPSAVGGWRLGSGGKFGSRFGKGKETALRKGGRATQANVQAGLLWLKKHQDPDGHWDCAGFMKHDTEGPPCDGPGNALNDVGVTGLALLAFVGDGSTMRMGIHRDVVRSAVKWLIEQQAEDGLFGTTGGHEFMYNHAIATLSMCEAYGLSDYKPLKKVVQKAINYIHNARNPYKVWRYYPRDGDNDLSVTGWMIMALKSAEDFKLAVDKDAFTCAAVYVDEVTDPSTGQAGYSKRGEGSSRKAGLESKFPVGKTEAMTAVGLLTRVFLGQTPDKFPIMNAAADTMLKKLPVWNAADGSVDQYYWYYASYALFQIGGERWNKWRRVMEEVVTKAQRKDGNFTGSWDPVDPWGGDGGRVYSTAIMVLCLEVYYRYADIIGTR